MTNANKRTKLVNKEDEHLRLTEDLNFYNSNFIAFGLCAIAFIQYVSTIGHGFVLDDGLVTTINSFVQKGFGGLWDILTHGYRAGATISTDSDYMYRPLSVLMFAIEWGFFSNQAWIHHTINILFYSATIYVLYYVLLELLGKSNSNLIIGVCILFSLHPIHTEVVSNIKSRDEILSLFFGLLSFLYCLKVSSGQKKSILWACLFFFLSLLSKEGAVTMLLIIPLSIYFFKKDNPIKYFTPLLIVFIGWFLIRYSIMGAPHYIPNVNDNQIVNLSFSNRTATAFSALCVYLKLLVFPLNLSWDYSYNQIPNQSWSNFLPILSALLYLSLLVIAIKKWKNKSVFSFCILAFLISMALYSNLFILIGTLIGERLAYQASLWFCLAFVFLLAKVIKFKDEGLVFQKSKKAVLFFSIISTIGLAFFYLSFQRAKDWKSSYSLFLSDVNHSPNSFRAYQAIADESLQLYMKKFRDPEDSLKYLTQAQKFYETSGSIKKTFSNQIGLGNTFLFQKNYERAIESFESAKGIIANTVIAERLATSYYQFGRHEAQINNDLAKAQKLMEQAYQLDSSRIEIITDLGMVYGLSKKFNEALYLFEKAYKINPKDEFIINNLANTYIFVGQKSKADELFQLLKK
ncbi:MAG: hypothetical protein ABI851_10720 [Saprospiraceae bacterium]